MSLKVEIHGDCLPMRRSASDIFYPQHHTFDNTFIGDDTIEHRDVVITWKGISMVHAQEIMFWEEAFRRALELLIEDILIEAFMKSDKCALHERLTDIELVVRLHRYANTYGTKKFSFPLQAVSNFMRCYYENAKAQYTWLMGANDYHTAMTNFLRTRSCFIQSGKSECEMSIQIWAYLVKSNGEASEDEKDIASVRIIGDVLSSPHRVQYFRTAEGKLKALFEPPVLDEMYPEYPVNISMQYTGPDGCDLLVTVTKHFPGHVRYEQTFRGRLLSPIQHNIGPLHMTPVNDRCGINVHDHLHQPGFSNVSCDPFKGIEHFTSPVATTPLNCQNTIFASPMRPQTEPMPGTAAHHTVLGPQGVFTPHSSATITPGPSSPIDAKNAFHRNNKLYRQLSSQLAEVKKEQESIKQQQQELLRMFKDFVAAQSTKAPKRPPSGISVDVPEDGHVSKKPKLAEQSEIPVQVGDATSRLTSLTLENSDHVTIDTEEYIDFSARSRSKSVSLPDSMQAQCSSSKAENSRQHVQGPSIRTDKAMREFLRGAGLTEFDIIGLMTQDPRLSSVSSLFSSTNTTDISDSISGPSDSEASTKPDVVDQSSRQTLRDYGLSLYSRPVSSMPSAPRMKPKRQESPAKVKMPSSSETDYEDLQEIAQLPGPPQTQPAHAVRDAPGEEEIEAERRRIQANFEEFLAKTEDGRADNGATTRVEDQEIKEFEAIFLEEADTPPTTEINVSRSTSDCESNPWWGLKTQ